MAKILGKNKSPICEIVMTGKRNFASFAIVPQTAKVMATVHHKCLVKMEKAFNWYKVFWERERDNFHIIFIAVYYYNCSILLLVIVVKLLLCLIYELNFTLGMHE